MKRVLLPYITATLLLGCAGKEVRPAATRSVALFPMANESVDVEAPAKVRRGLAGAMKSKGWTLVDDSKVDAILKDRFGVTDGGQLRAVPLPRMQGFVPGDLWCFGTVKEFVFKSAAAFSQRKVVIALRVVEASTGKVVFEGEETGVTSRAGVDAAGDTVLNLAGKVVKSLGVASKADSVADVELKQETREAALKLLEKFPR